MCDATDFQLSSVTKMFQFHFYKNVIRHRSKFNSFNRCIITDVMRRSCTFRWVYNTADLIFTRFFVEGMLKFPHRYVTSSSSFRGISKLNGWEVPPDLNSMRLVGYIMDFSNSCTDHVFLAVLITLNDMSWSRHSSITGLIEMIVDFSNSIRH